MENKENYTKEEIFEIENILREKLKGTVFRINVLDIIYIDDYLFGENGNKGGGVYKITLNTTRVNKPYDFEPEVIIKKTDISKVSYHILHELWAHASDEDKNILWRKL
ncbi:MAG: hypothetical protein PHP03_01855 [Candidatus Pacebacteria bacterium]|nr:hypothetical protein [Candidatus Paceibacterota bacterium]